MLMHIQVLQQFLITTALGEKIFKSVYAITADDPSKPSSSFCGKFREICDERSPLGRCC